MKNKVLIKLIIPEYDLEYDLFIPINIRIGTVIKLLDKSLDDVTNGLYDSNDKRRLYNVDNSTIYPLNSLVRETNIRNGKVVIFM